MVRFAQNALDRDRSAIRDAWVFGWTLLLVQASGLVMAQTTPPAKTDNEIKTPFLDNYTPSEEVKRRALGPLRIIKQTGSQKKPAAAPALVPAPVAPPKPKLEETVARLENMPPVVETLAAPPIAVAVAAAVPVLAPPPAPVSAPEPPKVAKRSNTNLVPIIQDPPVFSRSQMRENLRGMVKVAFDVNPDGSTSGIQVASSSNRRLNSSATDAVAKWKFQPIDEPVRVEIDVVFSLD